MRLNLTERDSKILCLLRYGLTSEYDIARFFFSQRSMEDLPELLRIKVESKVGDAENKLAATCANTLALAVAASGKYDGSILPVQAELKLIARDVKRLPKLAAAIRSISDNLPLKFSDEYCSKNRDNDVKAELAALIGARLESVIEAIKEDKEQEKALRACRRVMTRLVEKGFVRELVSVGFGKQMRSIRYYSLTSSLGKQVVAEIMLGQIDGAEIRAYQFSAAHARHESMVATTMRAIHFFSKRQGYFVEQLYDEGALKSLLRKRQKGQVFPDIQLKYKVSGTKGARATLNFEVDNGTQPFHVLVKKAELGIPLVIICANGDRANLIAENFVRRYKVKSPYFITTMDEFKAGGLFNTRYMVPPMAEMAKMAKPVASAKQA